MDDHQPSEQQPPGGRSRRARAGAHQAPQAGSPDAAGIVPRKSKLRLWWDWVLANAIGEALGLGGATAIAWFTLDRLEARLGLGAGVVVSSFVFGAVEGTVLGYFQHRVLRWPLPYLTNAVWMTATAVGGTIAWLAASATITLTGLANGEGAEPVMGVQVGLAALLGLAAGPVLGIPQAMALARWSTAAWHWVWANSLAWAAGMPIIFYAAGLPGEGATFLEVLPYLLGSLLVAGAVVGAIHGVVLVWLVGDRLLPSEYPHHVMDRLRRIDPAWLDKNDR